MTYNGSTALQGNMRHVLQRSHGRTTRAYKGANHPATFEIRATVLRVNTTLCNVVRMFVRPNTTIWIAKCCLWILNMFKSQRRAQMRPFYRIKLMRCIVQRKRQDERIAKFTIAIVLKRSGANCERGLLCFPLSCELLPRCFNQIFLSWQNGPKWFWSMKGTLNT